ncbi:class I SAM-dependent methyltransferase [Alicyclobacillus fastidiosus]|uniref:Class I SAM-dependent methyltransferase n=1 Tax=Alicyclobacillus fastidiosus TaxID=392011 RepID=A0ABY6ZLH9_9BACL|nr:class I SAM-dependent methyltransferase [Alicyclobacillus fastidiosus]WAH43768.1 class I SAM-dependent methyltransferase [Alicyclobacillus fastidiosus]GMA59989.1 putative methyltransferase YqeM [Alicyclobacillus fastidiosus]
MKAYDEFATVYDVFMADAPYDEWMEILQSSWQLSALDVADVGCGTGILTVPLSTAARTCIGVDASETMLAKAQERAFEMRSHVNFLCQDLRELRLPRPVDLVVSTCDVMNYLPLADLPRVFEGIRRSLTPTGVFAFDIIGPRRVAALAEGYWHQIEDDAVLLHETRVVDRTIEHEVHAFIRLDDGLYERIEEEHRQYYHEEAEITAVLRGCGFRVDSVLADFARERTQEADRLIFIAQV